MVTSNVAFGCIVKISMLRLNIGSDMLRLSSCMLRLGLRLSIGSCVLRLGLRLRLSFRGSGGLSLSPSLSMPEPMLSLSMLILATTFVLSQRDGVRQLYSNFFESTAPRYNSNEHSRLASC